MRILLIGASTSRYDRVTWADDFSSAPLGLLYLASMARMHGHEVRCVDQLLGGLSRERFAGLLEDFRPHVVGISAYTESVGETRDIVEAAHGVGAVVVMGGAHATFVARDVLASGLADYVVRFEGEATFVELLTHLEYGAPPLESIRGLAYRDASGRERLNPPRPHLRHLDGLPFPAMDALPLRGYTCPLVCLTSRGCPGRCLFCTSPPMHGVKYRSHTGDRVLAEVYTLARRYPGVTIAMIDDTFTLDRGRLERFCREVGRLVPTLTWSCYSRVDALDAETIALMAEAGCVGIQLGIEAGDQAVADSINKRMSLERAEEVVGLIAAQGIMPLCSLIIGHHSDTRETVRRTLDFGRRLAREYHAFVTFAMCTPFPGSPVYERCERLGVKLHASGWHEFIMTQPFISTSHLSQEELRDLYFEASQDMRLGPELKEYWKPILEKRLGTLKAKALAPAGE